MERNYAMNDMVTTGQVRNRPVTFTNGTAATRTVDVAVFVEDSKWLKNLQ